MGHVQNARANLRCCVVCKLVRLGRVETAVLHCLARACNIGVESRRVVTPNLVPGNKSLVRTPRERRSEFSSPPLPPPQRLLLRRSPPLSLSSFPHFLLRTCVRSEWRRHRRFLPGAERGTERGRRRRRVGAEVRALRTGAAGCSWRRSPRGPWRRTDTIEVNSHVVMVAWDTIRRATPQSDSPRKIVYRSRKSQPRLSQSSFMVQ
mmetsp:Transcript_20247/g.32806  ORF Transcript_20247/g.32806 Transcript_20247/m.32806 type:complete len:206 (-) Transcript_20247:151-768(-)